jgi:hypothetical protein
MNKSEYLENDICKFTLLTDIDLSIKKKLLVTSLFKMKAGGYRDFTQYLNGIQILDDIAKKNNMSVRIFIDKTIQDDKEIMDYLKSLETVSIILYSCPHFWIDDHHIGLFGTMVRFFPMFRFPNNDSKLSVMVDADTNEGYVNGLINLYKTLKKDKIHKKMYLAYISHFFHYSQPKMKEYDHNGKKYIFPYCIAQKLFTVKKIPKKPLVKFFEKIKLYMNDETRPSTIMSDYDIDPNKIKIRCENNICYGVDEYFLNHIVFKYLLKKNFLMCYKIKFDISNYYINMHPSNVWKYYMDKYQYKKIFYEYMRRFNIPDYSIKEVRQKIDDVDDKFINEFGKKMINMLETLDKEDDRRIFIDAYIYGLKQIDYKTYSYLDYIYFIGEDIPVYNIKSHEYNNI